MSLTRAAAVALVAAGASLLPIHEASARCWHGGWGWRCGPGPLALPFVAAGAAVAAATAPLYYGLGYYAPPPPPYYYPPTPGYYYPPPIIGGNDPSKSTNN